MPKLPGVRHQDAVRVLEKVGYRIIRQGGHIVMSNGETRLIIPRAKGMRPRTRLRRGFCGQVERMARIRRGRFHNAAGRNQTEFNAKAQRHSAASRNQNSATTDLTSELRIGN
jgi:predicted RNA binding protein YcfA (HicA-like mRNA interferase family)